MEEKMICILLDDYTHMAIMYGKVKALEGYVRTKKYSIDREEIAAILDFELPMEEDDE